MYSIFKINNYLDNSSLSTSEIWLKRINTIYFFSILFLATYFGKERAIFCDSSMQLFDMATTHLPAVNVNMSTTFINYVLPYFAILLGLPLKLIVYLMVINYLILPIAVFLFLRYKENSIKYELCFLVAFSIFNAQTFYYPIHDYWTGFYLLFVLYRMMDDGEFSKNIKSKISIVFLLIILIIFTHLSLVISIGFLFLYLFSTKKISFKQISALYFYILLILFFKILFINSGYQNNVIDITKFDFKDLIYFYNTNTFKGLIPTLLTVNINFTISIALFILFIFFKKNKLDVLVFFLILLVSLIVVYFLFADFGYNVYTEGYFKSLTIVAVIIFVNNALSIFKNRYFIILPLVLNYIFSFYVINRAGIVFEKQYNFINRSCKQFNETVYLKSERDICPLEGLSVSRQSIIINQIENNKSECIFSNIRSEKFVDNLNNKWIRENTTNPTKYFTFNSEIKYLDADSMQYPIDSLSVIFQNIKCDNMIKRLSGK